MRERGWRECQREKRDHELEEIELELKEDGERKIKSRKGEEVQIQLG